MVLIREYLTTEPVPSESDQADFVNDVLNGASELPDSSKSSDKKQGGQEPLSDPSFVALLRPLQQTFPVLADITNQLYERLGENLLEMETKILQEHVDRIISGEQQHQLQAASEARSVNSRRQQEEAFQVLMQELKEAMITRAPHVIWVESLKKITHHYYSSTAQYKWSGTHVIARAPQTRHLLYPLELTEQDSQFCQANEDHVPKPKLEIRHKFEFTLSTSRNIEFLQLIKDKCLAVISEKGKSYIYIEDNLSLDQSINTKPGKVTLNHDSLGGPRCLFAFDEETRLLAFIHGGKEPKLSVYIFDEFFSGLRSRGSPIPLKGWYDANVTIGKICFIPGTEEVCLVESSGRARIFSLVSQAFRPASLQIHSPVIDAISAPDGSCLLVTAARQGSRDRLLAFHWASFGKNQNGIHVTDIDPSDTPRVATRLEGRGRNHLLSLSAAARRVSSMAIQVKQKVTEFAFKSNQDDARVAAAETFNNSLIDCHYEVWTRFPVVPAVSRCTLSPIDRQPRKLVFQSLIPLEELEQYFARMILSFERTTRKPVDGTLAAISVFSSNNGETSLLNSISEFRFGSFIVELLCLIPLHLAITRDNRFIPLKDGVWDPSYERTLLGADVPAIIDALSLGWYESLFQSYMATKLVRVVSSMGEQSVGKSYCLNHFADTSFAGSAMRTTEGVWLSCTPTESYLLVSLDFEGVHSIERSAQEDALLVLFNTAVSNMVLFRNNFALSRDIAGLFTSFQSSAMVLDPNANKGLFNSTLAIIIKDVINSDAKDIVKEFSLKFRQIVEKEQDQNFISRLHRGHIQIIPWPVINSPGFYTLFRQLRAKLDQQTFTHGTAGAFLHNLKTLMAKIKAQDWGALDQNLAAHRAQQLLERLPRALCDGCTEDGPLKNMDTDEELSSESETMSFFISEFAGGATPENDTSIEAALRMLIASCGPNAGPRQYMQDGEYINVLQDLIYKGLEQRIDRVRHWINLNVARFPSSNQDVRNLFGKINSSALAMRANVRICSATCSECQLHCIRPYRHTDETHDCGTDHQCLFDCAIAEDHLTQESCGLPAGHSGTHMCDVKAHSCGNDCHLSKMGGCVRYCVKPPFHDGEHLCSARSHLCGKRCDLQNAGQRGTYSCPGTCDKTWDEPHSRHACDNARACPIECGLCRRLCCSADHFHGLDSAAVHFCGQEHSCMNLCEADGICQIETRPSAIQEQFSGMHEAFQYTRYSQVDRRLSCAVPIPPGELTHTGPHTHSTDDDIFHFCDTRCPNCEYLCTLPLGHPQQLHETSHGSMIATRWVVEGDDANPIYELQGRKFGSGDEGAPMLCSLVCAAQGRHAHIDYCRDPDNCDELECEHIDERMHPEPDRPKDWISHGFRDPYSQEEQDEFAKCDVLCAGPEHEATATTAASPSYCTLPIFHAPEPQQPSSMHGHVSLDGHSFNCQNPARLHQAYHIVFVIDDSGSMCSQDRRPLANTPITAQLTASCNNRYGAVLSALHGFWLSRESAASSSSSQARQDAYSVITFDHNPVTRVTNDFTSTTNQLITQLSSQLGCGGTDFHKALCHARSLIESHWSSDRAPVVVFLSGGECNINDNTVYDLCRTCVRLGKALAFYSVSFGTDAYSASLRQMADIAYEVYATAPQDVLTAARGNPCTYANAIDSIQLAATFLGIASSLEKPRGSLIGNSGGRRAIY
ncbi:E3 ubiquitin-protein ligase TRIP12 [Ceratobasidium sp. AG-Ba]|nr:E3 ubiquitin-protein ligase TRIP12 [Ceratobasidium sp. AG-Ba]